MRVTQVIAPARFGGAETVVVEATRALMLRGCSVTIAAVLSPGDEVGAHPFVDSVESVGAVVHRVVVGGRAYLAEARRIEAIVRAEHADVVHTHGYRADVVAGAVARRVGLPHITTLHGFTSIGIRGRLYEWLQTRSAARADRAICVSDAIAARVLAHDAGARVVYLPNAVAEFGEYLPRAEARRQLGIIGDGFVVGWIGRMSEEKAPADFVETISRLDDQIQGVMVGDGPLYPQVQAMVGDKRLRERLHLVGARPAARRFFSAFDALALTSRTEGTPMVLLEAALHGLPVAATAVGGVPAIFAEGTAALVPPGDTEALAGAVSAMFRAPEDSRDRANRARAYVRERFSSEAWVDALQAIYQEVTAVGKMRSR